MSGSICQTSQRICLVNFTRFEEILFPMPTTKPKKSASTTPRRIKKASSGTTIAVHLPADLRERVDEAANKSGLSKQDFYRLCLEIGMIFWDEAGSIAFTLHDAGKNPLSVAKVRSICTDYGLYLPEEVTSLRAAEKPV